MSLGAELVVLDDAAGARRDLTDLDGVARLAEGPRVALEPLGRPRQPADQALPGLGLGPREGAADAVAGQVRGVDAQQGEQLEIVERRDRAGEAVGQVLAEQLERALGLERPGAVARDLERRRYVRLVEV